MTIAPRPAPVALSLRQLSCRFWPRFLSRGAAFFVLAVSSAAAFAGEQRGIASVYWVGEASQPGTKTASGVRLDNNKLTAAHRSRPFGSKVQVENVANGRTVEVTITDRGPWVRNRVIDLTPAGARAIGMSEKGTAPVRLRW